MKYELRGPQRDCCNAVYLDLKREVDSCLAVMATGVGKTITAAFLIDKWISEGKRCLFLAHRDELINQAVDKFMAAKGIISGIEKASRHSCQSEMCVVGSVQSLCGKRLKSHQRNAFDYIITDEAHRSCSKTYMSIYDHFQNAKRLGITATAYRQKGDLSKVYQKVSFEYNLRQAITDGLLCRIEVETVPLKIDLSGVKTVAGDYSDSDLATSIEPYLESIAVEMKKRALNRKIIAFLPLVRTSKLFSEILKRHGFMAYHVDGMDRTDLPLFEKDGAGSVLCNSMLCTEGYDHPPLDCVVVLRPTKSTGLYSQMAGRITRLCEGKDDALILDFLWHSADHDLCKPSCLVSQSDEESEAMDSISSSGARMDIFDLEDAARTEIANDRERKLAEKLISMVGKKSNRFDPVLESLSIFDDRIVAWKPVMDWEKQEVTTSQKRFLEDNGFDPSGWDRGYASAVIGDLRTRMDQNLCSPKQMRTLLNNGYPDAARMSFQQASDEITKLAAKWEKAKRWKKIKESRSR